MSTLTPGDKTMPVVYRVQNPTTNPLDYKTFSRLNRKTQFVLGSDKATLSTEASHNFKEYSLSNQPANQSYKEAKNQSFVLGSHSGPYETTASKSFERPIQPEAIRFSHTPTQSIYFGDSKQKKISIGQSDYTHKTTEKSGNQISKVSEQHRNCHFNLGNWTNDYASTSQDYKLFESNPAKQVHQDFHDNIKLGSYKPKIQTEKQDKFNSKDRFDAVSNKDPLVVPVKKDNVLLGTEKKIPLATSADSYRGEQVKYFTQFRSEAIKANNIFLGNSPPKWESSYKQHFDEKDLNPTNKIINQPFTNFQLGFHEEEIKSLAQESYKKNASLSPVNKPVRKDNQVYLGGYKGKFETVYSGYGKSQGMPSRLEQSQLEEIKQVHFSLGNDQNEFLSNFQKDFSAPEVGEKSVVVNHNKDTNIVFGINKTNWTSMYSKSHS